ncbi:MAG: LysR family transcriptional regulator [Limosilactobacillus sp.]|nr:LysR family transcriptional regulator [Limosilactobacillus sp.]
MELKDLKYFKTLLDVRSYSGAAQQCGVTQPAISTMLKRLEAEMQTTLVTKTAQGIEPTAAGRVVYHRAQELLQLATTLPVEAQRANQQIFRIGYSELAGSDWLVPVINQLDRGGLLGNVTTIQENSHHLERHLLDGKYDAIVFSRLDNEKITGIDSILLKQYQFKIIVSENSPLAQFPEISLHQLQDELFLMRHKRFLSRIAFDQLGRMVNFKPQRHLIVDNLEAMTQLIAQGMGVGFLMDLSIKHLPGVVAIPLIPEEKVYCYSCLGTRHDFVPNDLQQACLKILSNPAELRELNIDKA